MRILRITVENLASLAGRHTVDFTAEPLRSTGLFAIIGPTGSGKSTLLDAMCLALFHETPRLQQGSRQTQVGSDALSENDSGNLLRRGTSFGLAEVAFVAVDGQTYTARWSLRRARNKVDGNLQKFAASLHRGDLRNDEQGEVVVAAKKTEVLAAIEERLGLNFKQFTRAVLLAQNEFSTFLRAPEGERATLLEALTDTSHFTRISKAIYQRCSDERKSIEQLEAQRQGRIPLTEDERRLAEDQRTTAHNEYQQALALLRSLEEQERWHNRKNALREQLLEKQQQHEAATRANSDAAPRRSQLIRIEQAQREAATLYSEFTSKTKELTERRQLSDQADADLTRADQESSAANQTAADAQEQLEELLRQHVPLRTDLATARSLDDKLEPAHKRFSECQREYATARQFLQKQQQQLQEAEQKLASARATESAQITRLASFAPYQPLAANADLWLTLLSQLAQHQAASASAASEADAAQADASSKSRQLEDFRRQTAPLQEEFDHTDSLLQQTNQQRSRFNGAQLRTQHKELLAAKERLSKLLRELERCKQLQLQLDKSQQTHDQHQAEIDEVRARIAMLDASRPPAEQALQVAQSAVQLIRNAFEDHAKRLRAELQHGKSCPVCGSIEHPWSQHPPDVETLALRSAEEKQQAAVAAFAGIQEELATLGGHHQAQERQQKKYVSHLNESTQQLAAHVFSEPDHPTIAAILALPVDARTQAAEAELESQRIAQEELDRTLSELDALDKQFQERSKLLKDRDEELKSRRKKEDSLLKSVNDAERAAAALEGKRRTSTEQSEETLRSLADFWPALPNSLASFNDNPQQFIEQLKAAFIQIIEIQTALQSSATDIGLFKQQVGNFTETCETAASAESRAAAARETAQQEFETLKAQRTALLDGHTVTAFEQQLYQKENSARISLDKANKDKNDAEIALSSASATAASNRLQLQQAEAAAHLAQSRLNSWLEAFSPESDQPSALAELKSLLQYSTNWITEERNELARLAENASKSESACSVLTTQYDEHLKTPVADDEDTVRIKLEQQRSAVQAAESNKNNADRIVTNDDELRQKNSQLTAEIAMQKELCKPWEQLNSCIGSADGKRFNVIAQRYTLDLLLRHANQQLRQLARRYRLERLGDTLNLAVIDQDLGDEQRSIHSLSGGETFLVSLGLALGLASLTSNRLRIESLFIDEGFGSLDEDTLEIAMNALNHLQSQGRKVGIITHVERMKDAIPIQIQVRKNAAGASKIILPSPLK